ncbi:hypothetical protein JR316_0008930 [Psilocybe cubensis]|uniref:Uncharacterized protein n=2 Tax=Psilocybe cubensis TaxID=181762 RepID=A0ACB8GU07_PSICU|nr:hypothetical protein JR316_0008930 [Psilocybe cubensis]KAH9478475.1 hypothetical protein JR316_0008930 [Psilocybe cubensis]
MNVDSSALLSQDTTREIQWPMDFPTYVDLVTMNGRASADLYFKMDPLKPESVLHGPPKVVICNVKSWRNKISGKNFLKQACSIKSASNGEASFIIHQPGGIETSVFATIMRRQDHLSVWHDFLWSDSLGFSDPKPLNNFIQDHRRGNAYSVCTKYGTQTFKPLALTSTQQSKVIVSDWKLYEEVDIFAGQSKSWPFSWHFQTAYDRNSEKLKMWIRIERGSVPRIDPLALNILVQSCILSTWVMQSMIIEYTQT